LSVGVSVEELQKYLESLYFAREWLIKHSRDVLTLCRKAIATCVRRNADSDKYVNALKKVFEEYREYAMRYPELYYSNLYRSIESEYVEAVEFCYMVKEGRVASQKELNVSPLSFLLGLLDSIGELKRYSLELIKRGRYDESVKVFEIAENLYNQVEELSFAENVVSGIKRKLDIYRKVLDDWKELLIDIISREKLRKVLEETSPAQVSRKRYDDG